MTRSILLPLVLAVAVLCGVSATAQNGKPIPGWYPLPDSLFLIWELEHDQVRRIRVIEEDHNAERAEILADQRIDAQEKDRRLKQLAVERRNEVRAVLQMKQFEDWERRSQVAGVR